MKGKGRYFHFLNLTFPRRWDSLCLQVVKNSEFWLRLAPVGLNMIRYFSSRHNLHLLVAGLYGAALPMISQEMVKGALSSFSFQI